MRGNFDFIKLNMCKVGPSLAMFCKAILYIDFQIRSFGFIVPFYILFFNLDIDFVISFVLVYFYYVKILNF